MSKGCILALLAIVVVGCGGGGSSSPSGSGTSGGGTSSGNPAPVATSLSQSSANAGSDPLTLTVTGSNFVSGSVVQWNGAKRSTSFSTSSTLTAAIPAADLAFADGHDELVDCGIVGQGKDIDGLDFSFVGISKLLTHLDFADVSADRSVDVGVLERHRNFPFVHLCEQ